MARFERSHSARIAETTELWTKVKRALIAYDSVLDQLVFFLELDLWRTSVFYIQDMACQQRTELMEDCVAVRWDGSCVIRDTAGYEIYLQLIFPEDCTHVYSRNAVVDVDKCKSAGQVKDPNQYTLRI